MKKRNRLIIMIIICALAIGLIIWRFRSQTFSRALSVDESAIDRVSVSVHAMVNHFGIESDTIDTYSIGDLNQPINMREEIIDILNTSSYRQDFRNLLLWDLDYVDADKNYDGRTVTVSFFTENPKDECAQIQFLSSSIIVVSSGRKTGFRVYHPTNRKTMDQLLEYVQMHGIKE